MWGTRFVGESALTSRIKSARRAVGDDGARQEVIRTVHGRGYELVAPVTLVAPEAEGALVVTGPPSPEPSPTHATRLPAAVLPLIGRDELLDALVAAVPTQRLITLAGPGGVGKTSVGYELARRVADRFPDGVFPVELVTVVDESATLQAIATALEVNTRQRASIDEAIVDVLTPRQALLLLDNCEHVIEPLAELVNRILRAAPGVSIVATSREPLALPSEHVWLVDPLPFAAADDNGAAPADLPAVRLFVERATQADAGFRLNPTTEPAVLEICRRLDGIPLAIELAATRARTVDVVELARRLDERFRLLRGVRRGADPRHRALEDAISWSYDLLSPPEQRLFAALAVFAGPFDLDGVEQVCTGSPGGLDDGDDDVLDLLTRLTERSMLSARRFPFGFRYEQLETLREYGRSRLDTERSVTLFGAHARHFADLARSVEVGLGGPGERAAVERADGAFADLRAAQRFAVQTGDFDTAFGLIGSIREYAMRRVRYETFAWAGQAVDAARAEGADSHPLLPLLTAIQGYGAFVRGDNELALALGYQARADEQRLGLEPSGLVERVLGNVLVMAGSVTEGLREADQLLALAEASGNWSRIAHASYLHSVANSSVGKAEEADRFMARAAEAAQRTGSPTDLASAAVARGFATRHDDRAALAAYAESDRLAQLAGNRWMSAFARAEASGLLVTLGELEAGCRGLAEIVDIRYRSGEWSEQWHTMAHCIIALERIGQPEWALQVLGAIEAHAAMGTPPVTVTLRDLAEATREALIERFGPDRTAELRAAGAALPVTDVVHRTRQALLGRPLTP